MQEEAFDRTFLRIEVDALQALTSVGIVLQVMSTENKGAALVYIEGAELSYKAAEDALGQLVDQLGQPGVRLHHLKVTSLHNLLRVASRILTPLKKLV